MDDTRRIPTRTAILCLGLAFAALFVLNVFVPSPASEQRAAAYFSQAQIERGLRYSYEAKLLSWCGTGLQLALLTALVCTSLGRRLTDLCERLTGRRWLLTLLLVSTGFLLLQDAISLPLGLIRLEHLRSWNMTERTTVSWLVDHAKGLGLLVVENAIIFVGLYGLMACFPRWWWLLAAAAGAGLGVLYAFLMPVLIEPLFSRFTPLEDPYLLERIRVLAAKAGVPDADVLVVDGSSRSRHSNAYFVGFGSTRRIVLYDTLLRAHSGVNAETAAGTVGMLATGSPWGPDAELLAARTQGNDEVESVLAHEIGHWRHDHIAKGLALGSVAALVGLLLLSRILHWAVGRRPFALTSITDPAGVPLVFLLVLLASWLMMPIQNGVSRHFERQADAAALELAGKPQAFIEAEKRLARTNLSNVAPTPFNTWMFATHPPAVERIQMAEKWKP